MPAIKFYPFEISYKVLRDRPVVHLFGKTQEGKHVCVLDESFEPYLWAIADNPQFALEKIASLREIKPKRIEQHKKLFLGREVNAMKVFANLPEDIPVLRDSLGKLNLKCLEADILFARRYLIDKDIIPGSLCHAEGSFIHEKSRVDVFRADKIYQSTDGFLDEMNMLSFDIETLNPLGKAIIPEEHPILMVAFYSPAFAKVITWKKFNTNLEYVEFVEDEAALINRFKEIIDEQKPDALIGYNSDGFDFPYLRTRAEKYKIQLDIGRDFSSVKFARGSTAAAEIRGIIHLDIFKFIRNIVSRTMDFPSLGLNSVSKELLNEQKSDVDIENLYKFWEDGSDRLSDFCEYNLKDAELTYKLAEKLFPSVNEFVKIVGLQVSDVIRLSFSQLVEWYLLREGKNFNELAPNKPSNEEIRIRQRQTYSGAFVYEPKPGLYNDVVVFDFRSLYPSIISAHNISPDTLNCSCCTSENPAPGEKFWFCKKRKGFIATVIEDLIMRRMRVKELSKGKKDKIFAARQQALKTIANAMYGYLGFFGARWYSIECAKSITAYGRFHIQEVIRKAKNEAFNVLYSDTDSVFLALDGKTKSSAELFVESINAELPGLMELDYEGFYPAGIFVQTKSSGYGAKKKYALLSEDGSIKIKGFEAVRRNLSPIAKEVQENVIRIILKENNLDKAIGYVKDIVYGLRQKKIPTSKMIISTQLTKDISGYDSIGPHVAIAQRMKNKGRELSAGTIIQYVVTEGKGRIRDRAKLPDEIENNAYDADYYINNQVLPVVDKIFEVLGYNAQDLDEKTQSKLSRFFE